MSNKDRLAHSLMMKFGLAPTEPTAAQLSAVQAAIAAIQASGKTPTEADWRSIVKLNCPSAGTHVYSGLDNSDLNSLLALATKESGGGK